MPVDRSLPSLARQLLACADDALLDEPLDFLARRLDDEQARDVLDAIHESGDARSLRDLLAEASLARWMESAASPREMVALASQLHRWLGGEPGEDDPSRLARVAALPEEIGEMIRWARPYGLLELLSEPAADVVPQCAALPRDVSVVECALGRADVRGRDALAMARAQDAVRRHLVLAAKENAAVAAREALWARRLGEGPLRLLGERLRALTAETPMAELCMVRFAPASPVRVDDATSVATGLAAHRDGPVRVELFLSGYEQRGLTGRCARCSGPGCVHVRALAARLLDACLDEGDRLRAPLARAVEMPSWQRFLRALDPDEDAQDGEERIAFRLRVDGEVASVGVVVRRVRADGGLSAGKLLSPRSIARAAARGGRDRAALELLAGPRRGAGFAEANVALLRALTEHPAVELDGSGEPITIREERVHVELREQPGGLALQVSLRGAPIPPGERASSASYLLQLDPARGALAFAALTPSLRRLLAALAHFRGVLPPESHPALAARLVEIGQVARVSAPESLRGAERPPPERLLLRIAPSREEGVEVTLGMRALPMGPLWAPGRGPTLTHGFADGAPVVVRRDLDRERELADRVVAELGLERHLALEPFAWRVEGTQAALTLLSRAARLTDALSLEWAERAATPATISTVRTSDLTVSLRKRGEWLSLSGGVHLPEADLAIGKLLDAARRGERYVRVEGQSFVEIERDLFERLARAQLCVIEQGNAHHAIAATSAPFWLETLGERSEGADRPTARWIERARAAPVVAQVGEALDAQLRGYQREGVAWMLERSAWAPGVCLADEMGLGKTVQSVALLDARASLGPALVVAPTSVVDIWLRELSRFAPRLRARAYRPGSAPLSLEAGDVLVASYDQLLRGRERFEGAVLATQIVDEAQMVKNARTRRALAAAGVQAMFRVALSGTPIENRLGDLWSLFRLIAPSLFGPWARFRARFAVPIERYRDEDRAAALRALVSPFVLRRTKEEVAPELPARTEVVHRVTLSRAEQDLYGAAARDARRGLGKRRGDDTRGAYVLAELTRLRQLACHPRLVIDDAGLESSKLSALLDIVRDIVPRGHRALVFSQFTRHLALVRSALVEAGVSCLYLDGSTPAAERPRLAASFQRGEASVFLISLKAGGTGLNLTAADYVVHLDPWWNPAAEDQASDRAHRIGQERPVTIVKLVATGTIEEKVLALHEDKRELAGSILDGARAPSRLDLDELERLLSTE